MDNECPSDGRLQTSNTWIDSSSAAFDFRGDVRTTPTAAMLDAVTQATQLDGIDGPDPSAIRLEEHMRALTGKDAALFVVSGTMGNLVSLRALLSQPPYSVICDARAHCLTLEAGSVFAFAGALPCGIHPANDRYLTLEDIIPHVNFGNRGKVHVCPTQIISLENTLRGMVMPLSETRRICDFAHENGIRVHLDGSRLWEVVAAGAGSLKDYCALFDTVTMCFSKGLGAPMGAVIVGDDNTIRHARWIRHSIGGSIRQPGFLAAIALTAIQETFEKNQLLRTHHVAMDVSKAWVDGGGKLKYPTETNMVWLNCEGEDFSLEDLVRMGREKGIAIHRERIVVHYQISNEAVRILKDIIRDVKRSSR